MAPSRVLATAGAAALRATTCSCRCAIGRASRGAAGSDLSKGLLLGCRLASLATVAKRAARATATGKTTARLDATRNGSTAVAEVRRCALGPRGMLLLTYYLILRGERILALV